MTRSVDDEAGGQRACRSEDGLTRIDGPLRHRVPLDLRAAATLDRAGDAAAHPERVVGRIDDGVDPLLGDVAFDDRDSERRKGERRLSPHLSRDRT